MKCKRSSDARSLSPAAQRALRQQAIQAIQQGQGVQEVASGLGVSPRSVYRWLASARGEASAPPGRPPKLSAAELQWLASTLATHGPADFQLGEGLWTLDRVGRLIQQHLGKTLTPRSAVRVLRQLGLPAAKLQLPDAGTRAGIRARGPGNGAPIYFLLRQPLHPAPELGIAPIFLLAAVGPRGETYFRLHGSEPGAVEVGGFVQTLHHHAPRPLYLVQELLPPPRQ